MKYSKLKNLICTCLVIPCLGACALSAETDTSALQKRIYDSWLSENKKADWVQTTLGSWIISSTKGDESKPLESSDDYPYVLLEYSISDLSGEIQDYSYADTAKVMRTYKSYNYYGPTITYRGSSGMYAGVSELVDAMNIGGSVSAVIPGWLLTSSRYDSAQEYLNNASSSQESMIYNFTVVDQIADVEAWELEQVLAKCGAAADSLAPGVYYIQTVAPDDTTDYESSSSVYVNYICRRLADGQGVDTNIKDSAKVFGFYSSSGSYEPMLINWGDEADDLTMTSDETTMITGFAYGLFQMHPHESGIIYMTSTYGYTSSGSGDKIPAYCPLIFEVSIVDEPEDD